MSLASSVSRCRALLEAAEESDTTLKGRISYFYFHGSSSLVWSRVADSLGLVGHHRGVAPHLLVGVVHLGIPPVVEISTNPGSVALGAVELLADAGVAVVEVKTLDASAGYEPYVATRAFWERRGFVQVDCIDPLPGWEPGNPSAIYVKALRST